MSSKKNNNWSLLADFSPNRYEVNEKAFFERKTPKSIHSLSNNFWNPIANVSVKEQYKTSIYIMKHSWKKFIPITEATIPIKTMKWKKSCNQIPSFMSKACLSTTSKTCMHHKKFKVFSSLRRPETHFRHTHGHQRASALTGSIKIFQSTAIIVYEVLYRKTVNTKLGKQNNYISEVITDFHHYFQEEKAARHKTIKHKFALHS